MGTNAATAPIVRDAGALTLAVEAKAERGELGEHELRFAALALVSAVVLPLLHQDGLGGQRCRPLDVEAFVRAHVEAFVRAYGCASVCVTHGARESGRLGARCVG